MKRAYESGKPWGVGEACNAYYGTPEQVSNAAKDGGRAYRSFEGRMESVAVDAYNSLTSDDIADFMSGLVPVGYTAKTNVNTTPAIEAYLI